MDTLTTVLVYEPSNWWWCAEGSDEPVVCGRVVLDALGFLSPEAPVHIPRVRATVSRLPLPGDALKFQVRRLREAYRESDPFRPWELVRVNLPPGKFPTPLLFSYAYPYLNTLFPDQAPGTVADVWLQLEPLEDPA